MKTNFKVVALSFLFFSILSFANNTITESHITDKVFIVDTQKETLKGVYKGHDDSGYIFSVIDYNGKENKVIFHQVDDNVLKANDLKSKALIDKVFEITYEVTMEEALDSNGETIKQETKTIKGLKASW